MGRPPAVVIVVRHGARLDAADKQWHLTSPTPYDPPLTYGGWTQCWALGARIAALLHKREALFDAAKGQDGGLGNGIGGNAPTGRRGSHPRRRRHRIILHSSPFLRCIQTSVAISAGMSQYDGENAKDSAGGNGRLSVPPPQAHSAEYTNSPQLSAIADEGDEEMDGSLASGSGDASRPPHKARLRLDAFLGEWLSPDYYESITPPPGSVLMLASAKAELLRRGEYIDPAPDAQPPANRGNFPGGWGSTWMDGSGIEVSPVLSELSSLSDSLPLQRDRASSHGQGANLAVRSGPRVAFKPSPTQSSGYVPPTPRYMISPQDPIPPGFVAHARDACVDVDYQWDSMRPPQDWGDGGEYGEEWSAMHKRFRKGLQSMIAWYRTHADSSLQAGSHLRTLHPQRHDGGDDDTDTVLVLVSHGAGCNALIGALTNQPVLMDVGMASLTMAVRREHPLSSSHAAPSSYNRRLSGSELSNEYELCLVASTDHFRPNSPSTPSQPFSRSGTLPHRRLGPSFAALAENQHDTFRLPDPHTGDGHRRSFSAGSFKSGPGLWSKPEAATFRQSSPHSPLGKTEPVALGAPVASPATAGSSEPGEHQAGLRGDTGVDYDDDHGAGGDDDDDDDDDRVPTLGLWGTKISGEVRSRDPGLKRRWTVYERQGRLTG